MLRTILIGLNGSEESAAARDLGLGWAVRSEARVFALGVVDEAWLLEEEATSLPGGHHWHAGGGVKQAATRSRIKEALREFDRRCAEAGVRCHALDEVGTPSAQIVALSRRCDIVLLGRNTRVEHGRGTLAAVLHECPRPVVAVPANPAGGDAALVAYDGSLQAARAIYAFAASGLGLGRPVHVVVVDRSAAEASHRAGTAVEFLKSHDIDAHPCPVATERAPAAAILERSRELDAGLVVMGTYGESALREFFLGSVTRAVLAESPAPVFCCG